MIEQCLPLTGLQDGALSRVNEPAGTRAPNVISRIL